MWKRLTGLLLALTLLAGTLALPAAAESADPVAMVQALGIMSGDQNGNLNLGSGVTRAQFCKMLVAASPYRDTVGGTGGYSLFTDVKSNHWAVEYIKTAVDNGWLLGYLDGSFHPDNTITLEEAATVALRLLGYTSADLAGSYPAAQLSKFNALGLHAGFSTGQGQAMSRMDCAWLFYNLMAAETKSGQIYGQTLGYTLDSTGHVDYGSLVTADTEGPFTASGGLTLPFSKNEAIVYRNGVEADWSDVANYDVYYYNENLRTVWVYSNRVTGTYTAATPSTVAPTSVTVAGNTYAIESSAAAYKLSAQGEFSYGDTVTLLLGMNGGVADVVGPEAATGLYYGVVVSNGMETVTETDGAMTVDRIVKVFCTDGATRSFAADYEMEQGTVVQVDYTKEKVVTALGINSLSGKVNTAGTSLGSYRLADNVEILDTDGQGNAVRIYSGRLAGYTLERDDVRYYTLNSDGAIDRLILQNATGDATPYGVITLSNENEANGVLSSNYAYLLNGTAKTVNFPNTVLHLNVGGAAIVEKNGVFDSAKNLEKVNLTSLTDTGAVAGGRTYKVSEQVLVYIVHDGQYVPANIQAVQNTDQYSLTGYYDDLDYSAGGQIRVVLARAK